MSSNERPTAADHAVYDDSYTRYQTERSAFRRWVRRIYIRRAAALTAGPALDFGCGVGEVLRSLPSGSMGVEYNEATVQLCHEQGLNVQWYDGFADNWTLSGIPWRGRINTLILSHVLEHFDQPETLLRQLLQTTAPDIRRAVVIVPGRAGFRSDPTHRTHVDLETIRRAIAPLPHWRIASAKHFPFNWPWVGNLFAYNELQVVLQASDPI